MTTADNTQANPAKQAEEHMKHKACEGDTASASSSGWEAAIFCLVTFIILLALAFWPITKQFIPGSADPPSIQPLGQVAQTRFVGGLGPRTEVRTESKVLLLRGAVELDAGVAVERRTTYLNDVLCVSGTGRCHEILSR